MGYINWKAVHRCRDEAIMRTSAFFSSIGFVIFLPIFLTAMSPILLIRECVRLYAKHYRPDLGQMMTTFSSAFTVLNVYSTTTPLFNCISGYVVSGKVDIDEFREAVNLRLINSTRENGESKYPELKQSVSRLMGFAFWKWDKEFDIKNHVHLEYHDKVTKEMNNDIQYKLVNKPYPPDRPPWEIVILQNYVDTDFDDECPGPKSVIHLRYHHSIGDGFSVLKALYDVLGEEEQLKILKKPSTTSKDERKFSLIFYLKSILFQIWSIIRMPYNFIYIAFDATCMEPFGKILPEYSESQEFFYKHSPRIRSDYVKNIKNGHNVQFTSVLLAAVTAATRKALTLRYQPIPEYLYLGMPYPIPGHPFKLRNWATMGRIKLPLGEPDSLKRLQKCNEYFLESKRSSFQIVIFHLCRILCCIFLPVLKIFFYTKAGGIAFISFPGPPKQLSAGEHKLLNITFMDSFPPGNLTLGFGIVTYLGRFQLICGTNKGFYTEESKITDVLDAALKELDILHGLLT